MNTWQYCTPWGPVTFASNGEQIIHVYLPSKEIPRENNTYEDALLKEAGKQLQEYLKLKRYQFDVPLHFAGTPFMVSVWQYLQTIPYGSVVTYKEIAEKLNCPLAYRAVGMANARNPLALFLPCHRVIGTDGSLTGFGGGLAMKKGLLGLEKKGLAEKFLHAGFRK